MSVNPRGEGFEAYVSVNGQRVRKTFNSRADAIAFEALAREALEQGRPIPDIYNVNSSTAAIWSLKDAADRCFKLHWQGKRSENKTLIYVNRILKDFGTRIPVTDISTVAIDNWILKLRDERNLSGGTINRNLSALSKILRTAHESGHGHDRMPRLRRQKEGQHRLRWLTKEEAEMIIQTSGQYYPDLRDAIVISLDTGIRKGELKRLEPRDVVNGKLMIWEAKNDESRSIPLTKRAAEVLARRSLAKSPTAKLFDQNDWIRSPWEHIKELCDMGEDVVWHTLRHTFASWLVQKGVPIQVVKELMGHKTIQMTMRYAKLAPKNHDDAIGKLED